MAHYLLFVHFDKPSGAHVWGPKQHISGPLPQAITKMVIKSLIERAVAANARGWTGCLLCSQSLLRFVLHCVVSRVAGGRGAPAAARH